MNLIAFPIDIVIHIMKQSSCTSIANLGETCKILNELSKLDEVWSFLCKKDYGVTEKGDSFSSGKELYKFLFRYGHMLGTYMVGIDIYGGVSEIKFLNGRMTICSWHHSSSLNEPLRADTIATIDEKEKDTLAVHCKCSSPSHEAQLYKLSNGRRFGIRCDGHLINFNQHDVLFMLTIFYKVTMRGGLDFFPIKIPDASDIPEELLTSSGSLPASLVPPGLFCIVSDEMASNVPEFILFDYKNEGNLHGSEVSKSLLSPQNNVSVKVNLAYSFEATVEQQSSSDALIDIPKHRRNIHPRDLCKQTFILLSAFRIKPEMKKELRQCKARYHGFAKFAWCAFESVHFIVFSNDVVGILFLKKCRLVIYKRPQQKFTRHRGRNTIYVNT